MLIANNVHKVNGKLYFTVFKRKKTFCSYVKIITLQVQN